ncbi:MAG: single-stranded DNA-binding protein [Fibrobacterota bacterium]
MVGVNKVILIGNLGKDPELRRTPGGQNVTSFSLATTERYTGRDGEKKDNTEWHNVVAWGRLAELSNQYLRKGRSVYVEGRIQTRSWDDRDGNKRYRTEIVANSIQFLNGGSSNDRSYDQSPQMEHPAPEMSSQVHEPDPIAEDDLPF